MDLYGSSIAVAIHSLDHSLSARLIAPTEICVNMNRIDYNTISLKCLCIDCVNQVKKLAWSGTRSLVSAHSRRGKGISIALVIHSLFTRLIPVYGVSERYSKDIICTIIQAKWYNFYESRMPLSDGES